MCCHGDRGHAAPNKATGNICIIATSAHKEVRVVAAAAHIPARGSPPVTPSFTFPPPTPPTPPTQLWCYRVAVDAGRSLALTNQPRRVRRQSGSLFDLLHVVDVSVEEVSHRVPDGCVLEARGGPKHCDVGHGGAQLSHGLTLKQWKQEGSCNIKDVHTWRLRMTISFVQETLCFCALKGVSYFSITQTCKLVRICYTDF